MSEPSGEAERDTAALRALADALVIEDRYAEQTSTQAFDSSTALIRYRNALRDPQTVLALLDRAERAEAALRETWVALVNAHEASGPFREESKRVIAKYRSQVNNAAVDAAEAER